ncbi:hypothetical protein ACHAW6_007677 [Cyclotella cf. meneghiniana]
MPSFTWISLRMPLNCACSLVALTTTGICGQVVPHIFKPLTDHSGLKKHAPIPLTTEMQMTFDKMHALMVADALTATQITTNGASDFQLGACIVQEGCPVAYFSRKPSKSQQNYMVVEKEM